MVVFSKHKISNSSAWSLEWLKLGVPKVFWVLLIDNAERPT